MILGIIGYRNHAGKLIKILNQLSAVKKIIVYYPNKKKLEKNFRINSKKIYTTNSINQLCNAKGIIIASKSSSHYKYLKILYKKNKYIFCEKPPADNSKHLNLIKRFSNKKIKFNFHLIKTFFSVYVKKILINKELGNPINISIESSQGIAFKKNFKKNWRFNENNIFSSVIGNLGIHYIRQLNFWFNHLKLISVQKKKFSNIKKIDTANINFIANKKINVNIFLSYAAPKINLIKIIFTNGCLVFNDGKIEKYFPRDVFSRSGQFKSPKARIIKKFRDSTEHNYLGLKSNLKEFLKILKNNKSFDKKEFNDDIKSTKIILDVKKN